MAPLRILVVDDFAPWRKHLRSLLQQSADFEVVGEAGDGWEAIQKDKELQPDLILMDITMPKLNGMDASKRIRESASSCKILFLSVAISPDLADALLAAGGQGYIAKSEVGSKLLSAIDNLFRKPL